MPIDVTRASDAELVSRFAAGRDQRAFAEIVRRHGPMVMGVAVRVLRNGHDADDAFQATFLALACAAGRLRRQASVAAWLHGTVVRSARSIRRMNEGEDFRRPTEMRTAQVMSRVDESIGRRRLNELRPQPVQFLFDGGEFGLGRFARCSFRLLRDE